MSEKQIFLKIVYFNEKSKKLSTDCTKGLYGATVQLYDGVVQMYGGAAQWGLYGKIGDDRQRFSSLRVSLAEFEQFYCQ